MSLGPHTQVCFKRKQSTSGSGDQYNKVETQSVGSSSRNPNHEIALFSFVLEGVHSFCAMRESRKNSSGPGEIEKSKLLPTVKRK